VKWSRYFEL